ncbi:hypothetical protein PS6_011379 [Mucor atramentarius]
MTSDLFCENTMSTVLEQKIFLDDDESTDQWKGQLEVCLRDIYTSVKNQAYIRRRCSKVFSQEDGINDTEEEKGFIILVFGKLMF